MYRFEWRCFLAKDMLKIMANVTKVVFIFSLLSRVCKGLSTPKHNITQYEKVLLEDLFRGYNKQVRPVLNWSQPIYVSLGLALSEVLELNAKNQVLVTNVWMRQKWKDEYLTWNPALYGGITSITIDPDHLWKPDILLYNNVQSINHGEQYLFKTKITITNEGTATWFSPNKQTTSCKIEIRKFPFDTQRCTLTFGPWTYTGSKLILEFWNKIPRIDLSIYSKNAEFDLLSSEGKLNKVTYSCCPNEPYYDITYTLVLKRKPLFYLNNLILPCIVLALLTGVSFLFPPETGERVSLVVTVLLGMTVFMIVFTEFIPASSEDTPLIGKFFITVLFEVAACLLATSVPLRLQHLKPGTEMPHWCKVIIFDYLAFALCFQCKRSKKVSQTFGNTNVKDFSQSDGHTNAVVIDIENEEVRHRQIANNGFSDATRKHTKDDPESGGVLYEGMATVKNFVDEMGRESVIRSKWKDAIAILDRLFFYLFLVTFTVSSIVILLGL